MKAIDRHGVLECGCAPGYVDCPEAARIRARADRSWAAYRHTGSLKALAACRARITEYREHHETARVSNLKYDSATETKG